MSVAMVIVPAPKYRPPWRIIVDRIARQHQTTYERAIATLLDMVHKPGIQVRILGGSLEQSCRMHEHLRRMLERLQAVLDKVDESKCEAILFGYGLCNNGLAGLKARTVPIVVPRGVLRATGSREPSVMACPARRRSTAAAAAGRSCRSAG